MVQGDKKEKVPGWGMQNNSNKVTSMVNVRQGVQQKVQYCNEMSDVQGVQKIGEDEKGECGDKLTSDCGEKLMTMNVEPSRMYRVMKKK